MAPVLEFPFCTETATPEGRTIRLGASLAITAGAASAYTLVNCTPVSTAFVSGDGLGVTPWRLVEKDNDDDNDDDDDATAADWL